MPKTFTTEGLLGAFKKVKLAKKRFLLLRTNIAPDLLRVSLEKSGAIVTEIPIYRTEKPEGLPRKVAELMHQHPIDYITFTSSSTAQNFFEVYRNGRHYPPPILPPQSGGRRKVGGAKVISIGPVTSKTIRGFGVKVDREARVSTIPGLVKAVLEEEAK